jgi:DNA-binding PadR family transcriptional regulator
VRDRSLTPLALAVLDLLSERDMHPYEMNQTLLTRQSDQRMKITAGSLYHAVDRLLERGLIEARETTREGKRPERTVYRLTEAGSDAFTGRLREMLSRLPVEYPEFPNALSMMHNLPQGDAVDHLGRRLVHLRAKVAMLQAVTDGLAARDLPAMYWIDIRYTQAMAEAELAWTQEFLDGIGAGKPDWPTRHKKKDNS